MIARGVAAKARGFALGLLLACLLGGGFIGVAAAQAPDTQVPGFHHNTRQPIKIDADKLEVRQNREIAIFTGNVVAVQGEMKLRADTLKVHYHGNQAGRGAGAAAATADPRPKPGAAGPGAMGAISEIDAFGHVFLLAPGETAQGSAGVYDVEKHVIVLTGTPVVLTRGKNVLTGQRVRMNLDTGMSELTPVAGGRVHGLFVPEQRSGRPEKRR